MSKELHNPFDIQPRRVPQTLLSRVMFVVFYAVVPPISLMIIAVEFVEDRIYYWRMRRYWRKYREENSI